MDANSWIKELALMARPEKVKILSNFFKTGKGQYGEGDKFLGIVVPDNRSVAKKYYTLDFLEITKLLTSEYHEHRLSALLALVHKYEKGDKETKANVVDFYLANTIHINNWDLVDLSAPQIIGGHALLYEDNSIMMKLSDSDNMWEKRIAIVATYTLIKNNRLQTTITLSKKYLNHPHDLIHKATGWMLRELGKKDIGTLLSFLDSYATTMPRTALRYAIEKLDPETRQHYMKAKPNNH